jgi:hypothetical protein
MITLEAIARRAGRGRSDSAGQSDSEQADRSKAFHGSSRLRVALPDSWLAGEEMPLIKINVRNAPHPPLNLL